MSKLVRCVPPLPSTERGTRTKLSFDSAGGKLLYCNNNNIIVRSVAQLTEGDGKENPEEIYCDRRHAREATAVAISPNGNYVASGDNTGKLVVWGSKGDHTQKGEYPLWSGVVRDVCWSSDSTRIFACGNGNTKATAIIWDTGSKTGEVAGHSKPVNSIAFRSQRPFRILTGGEDFELIFHQGVPFKGLKTDKSHTNVVNWTGFSPDGEWAASAGSDSKLLLFKGTDGDLVNEFKKPEGMSGSIWDAAWSPDSNRIVTAGGDKKLRVWDREAGAQLSEFSMTDALEDMQVGVEWITATTIASLCLDGRIQFFDITEEGTLSLKKCIDGAQGALTCLAREGQSGTLCMGGGNIFCMIPKEGALRKVKTTKTVKHVVCHDLSKDEDDGSKSDEVWVMTLDDCVRRYSLTTGSLLGETVEVKEFMGGADWLDQLESKLLVATSKGNLKCVSDKEVLWTKAAAFPRRATACATLKGRKAAIAIEKGESAGYGKAGDPASIYMYNIGDTSSADGIVEETILAGHKDDVFCLRFSPDGDFLASCDGSREINIWCLKEGNATMKFEYAAHTARVSGLTWLPSGQLVSCSLDQSIVVYDVDYSAKTVKINKANGKGTSCHSAHRGGANGVVACGANEIASVGADGFLLIHGLA